MLYYDDEISDATGSIGNLLAAMSVQAGGIIVDGVRLTEVAPSASSDAESIGSPLFAGSSSAEEIDRVMRGMSRVYMAIADAITAGQDVKLAATAAIQSIY